MDEMVDIPCAKCKATGVHTVVVAMGLDEAGLPLVTRVCQPCSLVMVEEGNFSYKAQMRYMSLLAADLAEQVQKMTNQKE